MSSKTAIDVDFTGQWKCTGQENMEEFVKKGMEGGFLQRNAAWMTGYGVGKTVLNIDHDGNNFSTVMNGPKGDVENDIVVGEKGTIKTPMGKEQEAESEWVRNGTALRIVIGGDLETVRYINDDGELVIEVTRNGITGKRIFTKQTGK